MPESEPNPRPAANVPTPTAHADELVHLRLILDHTRHPLLLLNRDDVIIEINATALRLLQFTRQQAIGSSIGDGLLFGDDSELRERVQQAVATARDGDDSTAAIDGDRTLTFIPVKSAGGPVTHLLVELHEPRFDGAEVISRALRESEAKSRAILDTAVDGIVTIDPAGRIMSFNLAAERLFGYRSAEVIGRNVSILMPDPYHSEHDDYLKDYLHTGLPKIIGIGRDVVARRNDGTVFPVYLAVSEVRIGELRMFTGIIRDLTERTTLEKEILEISDREKRRLGQDLHDGLGQLLTGIGFKSKSLENKLAARELPEAANARQLAELVTQAISESRAVARGLQPVGLEDTGLMTALQELVTNVAGLFKIDCTFKCPEPILLNDAAVAMHLYRIAQEAVNNVVKHARAFRVEISLRRKDDKLCMAVRDDGIGFVPRPGAGGMGLNIMRYRAAIIRGALSVEPNGPSGTTVSCTVAYAPAKHTGVHDG